MRFLIPLFLCFAAYAQGLPEKRIELFTYWQPDLKGEAKSPIQERMEKLGWKLWRWDKDAYRPWVLSWKEVKNWQDFKWWMGWGLSGKSPFHSEETIWVFFGLGLDAKFHDFSRVSKKGKERMVLFLWEPCVVEPEAYAPEMLANFGKVFTMDDDLVDGKKFFKFYYPGGYRPKITEDVPPFEEKKFCTLFSTYFKSKHPNELYSERVKMAKFFEDKEGEFDLYGRGWAKKKLKNWRGPVDDKIGTLKGYKFCICYENTRNVKGYITEKIFDAFIAGSVPVYWGANNITDYIPKGAFIDRREFESDQAVYDFMKNMTKEEYESYVRCAEEFLKSEVAKRFTEEYLEETFMKVIP